MSANERALDGTIIKWQLNGIRLVDGKKCQEPKDVFLERLQGIFEE
jgi:hypothetical protein